MADGRQVRDVLVCLLYRSGSMFDDRPHRATKTFASKMKQKGVRAREKRSWRPVLDRRHYQPGGAEAGHILGINSRVVR